ncbi:MAG: FAD-binding oxidoreductase [Fulvimonas sp.]|nr:FAD-binding oxidoreductase [Fulvimonas sp.]
MPAMLPAGLSAAAFSQALAGFRQAVGKAHVYAGETALSSYLDPYSTTEDAAHTPAAAVAPHSVEEIQAVLKVAREYGIPLWPVSTGKNYAYGGPAPRKSGYVVLDLARMNRIIEVNARDGYAVVEPGVSYFDLYRYLKEHDIPLWIDCAAPGWGSVLGNLLDHGAGYTPYGEHLTMQCGMQVVLADGTVVDTATGALPGARASQLYKWGAGPWIDGLFTQSGLGIVTRLGVWLMPEPPGYRPFMVTFPDEDALHDLTEAIRPLKLNMVIPNGATSVELLWEAATRVTKAQYYGGKGPLPPSVRRKLMADLDIGAWNFYAALYGPPPMIERSWSVVRDALGKVKGARFYTDRPGDTAWEYRAKLMRGIPNMTEYSLMNWIGSGAHIDFSPMSAPTGDDAVRLYHLIKDKVEARGFDYIGEFLIGWRDQHHIFMLIFDRTDPQERERAHQVFGEIVADAAAQGFGEYRTHLDFMDQIAATYDWNDHALRRLNERVRDALDPGGIMAPGKMGVWPRRMRA